MLLPVLGTPWQDDREEHAHFGSRGDAGMDISFAVLPFACHMDGVLNKVYLVGSNARGMVQWDGERPP